MNEFLQFTVNGIVVGSILAISAVGLTLVYGILKLVNFAHGDYLTFGAYMALIANVFWGLHPVIAAVIAVLLTVAMSVSLEYGLWRPMRGRGAGSTSLFLTSIGLALVLRHVIQYFFGTEVRVFDVNRFQAFSFGPVRISLINMVGVSVSVAAIIAIGLFLSRTRLGKALRAMSDNPDLAAVSGIDINRVTNYTWVVAGGAAGLSGLLFSLFQGAALRPDTGWLFLLPIFAAVTLGGVGNPYGALAGGLLIGLVMELSGLVLPLQYKNAVAFAVMIGVLLVRPEGMFGKARVL